MTNANIIAKPYVGGMEIDKARHVSGFNRWSRSSRFMGTIMLILGWFTIPFEVIFRRDFGQRWFTAINYLAGLLLLFLVAVIHGAIRYTWEKIMDIITPIYNFFHASAPLQNPRPPLIDPFTVFVCLSGLYIFFGLYHLFKIKWRNQVNMPLHSYDDGKSRLRILGFIGKVILNFVTIPLMLLIWLLIPYKQRVGRPRPRLISNALVFTHMVFEPGIVFFLGWATSGFLGVWLYMSAVALFVHAQWKEIARKNKILDFQDSRIEAEIMRELHKEKTEIKVIPKKRERAKKPAQVIQPQPRVAEFYPKLSFIIEEMNRERTNLAN